MKVKTISYQKVFPLGQYINERIGIECEIREGEDIMEVLSDAKAAVEKFHKDTNPGLYMSVNYEAFNQITSDCSPTSMNWHGGSVNANPLNLPPKEIQQQPPSDKIQSFIDTINYCTNKNFLMNFKKRVDEEESPRLTEAYYKKLKSFE